MPSLQSVRVHPLEGIEAHYGRSSFIKEVGLYARPGPGDVGGGTLRAVVVPDMERLRAKRIVNVGDLLRFEIEGLTAGLPRESRVVGYDISFVPLPRTSTGALDRDAIARLAADRADAGRSERPLTPAEREWLADPLVAVIADVLRARGQNAIRPDANLEIDLGIDSLARVELLSELQQRCGALVLQHTTHEIFTVGQLVDALRAGSPPAQTASADPVWARLCAHLPLPTDPMVRGLLDRKPLAVPLVYAAYRLWRCVVHLEVSGLEHVERSDAFILAPNHQSYLDPFFVSTVLPYRVFKRLFLLGAIEYFETPITRWLARALNIVPVDPDANLVGAMQAGAFGLTHGKILIVFPEGERSIDGRVKRFKKGATILSAHLGVPIVPVAITGSFEVWPRNRPIGWRQLGFWNRHRVRIRFGAPMQASPGGSYVENAQQLQDAVEALWS